MHADPLRQLQAPIKARYKKQLETARHRFRASRTLLPDWPSVHIDTPFDTPFARCDAGLHPKAGGDGSEACFATAGKQADHRRSGPSAQADQDANMCCSVCSVDVNVGARSAPSRLTRRALSSVRT